ncbi:MAG: radical SAM protein [Betaproteobacteria bacterium]
MAKFVISAADPRTEAVVRLLYDNMNSSLTNLQGHSLVQVMDPSIQTILPVAPVTSKDTPLGKSSPRILKISLGLSCNYACEYCSQRFVARNDETNPEDVADFMDSLDNWVLSPPEAIEFWGGEPLVYIKTMRPLAEALRKKYPQARFSVITNGSLLNVDLIQWLDDLGFAVSVSHDGPGQHVRGPDPLADPPTRKAILDLYQRLAPQGRFSFNAMLNRSNQSRSAIQAFFTELTGDPKVMIGEGGFVDAYDVGGEALSLRSGEFHSFRRQSFKDIRQGKSDRIASVRDRMMSFVNSIRFNRPASSLGQKCGMDKSDSIAVDLKGNVLTCQNVSALSTAPNGESHRIGNVRDLTSVELRTSTHWSKREGCPKCPVLHICKGACMFLEGPLWEKSCDNAYSDALPIFTAGIEFLTGLIPVHIEGEFRTERKDIFGLSDQPVTPQAIKAKPFPIPVVSV